MKIAVIDFETDPFKYQRVPRPFCCEFLSDELCEIFWGDDCADQLARYLEKLDEPHLIYAHNGGKFDFHFLHDYLENPVKVINARIVSARFYAHELRDSYAILPVPLRAYEKEEFDYANMEKPKRQKFKQKILDYLHSDCVSLLKLVAAFVDRFGDKLTIGSTAMAEIKKRHPFIRASVAHDETFRRFYYGGRVQCFRHGILPGPWKCYDVNSSYPKAMRDFWHPINGRFETCCRMPDNFDVPFFVQFEGTNKGALPVKCEDGSLSFEQAEGEFLACSHELEVGLRHGMVDIRKIHEVHVACETMRFTEFVDEFYAQKTAAKKAGDKITELFAKLLLNSGYGKFGQNPDHFKDWIISRDPGDEITLEENGYERLAEFPAFDLWARPSEVGERALFDVAVAASITSASRSILLEGLRNCRDPAYCDTDSIICRDFAGDISDSRLGAWKLEKTTQSLAIAGKKLYAMYDDETGEPAKLASKGGMLKLPDILDICRGKEVLYQQDAPTFSVRRREVRFSERKFKMTVDDELGL
jgi:hypothetical protein